MNFKSTVSSSVTMPINVAIIGTVVCMMEREAILIFGEMEYHNEYANPDVIVPLTTAKTIPLKLAVALVKIININAIGVSSKKLNELSKIGFLLLVPSSVYIPHAMPEATIIAAYP